MGSRPSVYVIRSAPAPTLPVPNSTIARVTVELRAFYPPTAEGIDIALVELAKAYIEATEELQARQVAAQAAAPSGPATPVRDLKKGTNE